MGVVIWAHTIHIQRIDRFIQQISFASTDDGSLDIEEFAFNASAEDLALFCAEKAGIPSKFFPLFALYSPNHEVFLPPGYEFASLARDTVNDDAMIVLLFGVCVRLRKKANGRKS